MAAVSGQRNAKSAIAKPSSPGLAKRKPTNGRLRRRQINFSVDASLLRELGDRLVGQPHIALAELVKNSYDADARHVRIVVEADRLVVEDDGNGMNFAEFQSFWMRIGTPHKQNERISTRFKRPLTGSKGVGRLAVQFLGRQIELSTTSRKDVRELSATVDWDEAVSSGELTSAKAWYAVKDLGGHYAAGSRHGTRIEIQALNDTWSVPYLRRLAQEIWTLQPPAGAQNIDDPRGFEIELQSSDPTIEKAFSERLKANLSLWSARIRGKLLPNRSGDAPNLRYFTCGLQFRYGKSEYVELPIEDSALDEVEYDIRIFSLFGKQQHGIGVEDARRYLRENGGVHIYDAGFHLPYYGPAVDWLNIEFDHAHRLSESERLPTNLQVARGLNNLPTSSRIYGVVKVDTSHEFKSASRTMARKGQYLQIQVSRDRLVDNTAFSQLRSIIRTTLDFYAVRETARRLASAELRLEQHDVADVDSFHDVVQLLDENEARVPEDLFAGLRLAAETAASKTEAFKALASAEVGLLGSLAAAGINMISLEHETNRELIALEGITRSLVELRERAPALAKELDHISGRILDWITRARATRAVLSPLLNAADRVPRSRLNAASVAEAVVEQITVFTRSIPIDLSRIDKSLRLPSGTMAEWSTVLQNVLINAVNALLDTRGPMIQVSTKTCGLERTFLIQDNGTGIDLGTSQDFFKPFQRASEISPERRALGLGGLGMGLTIVRMLARHLDAEVRFVKPEDGFATAFALIWTERQ